MGKGQSIFDRESTKLGRPLNIIDKVRVVSKYTFISSLLVLIPFLLFDFWDVGRLYDNPENKVFENIKFEVKRAPKGSEARVGLYSSRGQIFSSSCYGIETDICNKEDFWKPSLAKEIRVIEVSPNKGIISNITVSTPSGDHAFTNSEVEEYVKNYSKRTYRKDWILLLISAVAGIIYFASNILSHTNHKGK